MMLCARCGQEAFWFPRDMVYVCVGCTQPPLQCICISVSDFDPSQNPEAVAIPWQAWN